MKFQILVKDSKGVVIHEPGFDTREEAEAHEKLCLDYKNYPGFPLKKIILKPESATTMVDSDTGEESKIIHEAEEFEMFPDYTVEILDKSAEVEAEKVKLKKEQANLGLKAFDLSKIKDADVKAILKFILDKLEGL